MNPTCGEIIHLAHHAAGNPTLWDEVSARLCAVLSADIVAFIEHNFITHQGQISHAAGIEPSFRELYGAHYAGQNVWLHAKHLFEPGQVFTGAELVANWELVRTEFYRHWLRPQRAFHCLFGGISRCGEEIRCLIALRPLERSAFDARDKHRLASLLPHLQCADELGAEFAANRLERNLLMAVMRTLPEAVFVVDGKRRPVLLNRAAERLLAQNAGLVLVRGVLAAISDEGTCELRRLVAAAIGCHDERAGKPDNEIAIGDPSGHPHLILRIAPIRCSDAGFASRPRPLVAVFAHLVEPAHSARHLCEFYQMTPAETRLTTLIVGGHSLVAAAAELHISKNTARTHMKRIYMKTETHRQVDLIRLCAEILPNDVWTTTPDIMPSDTAHDKEHNDASLLLPR
jgi:DNA-binding CsgD family transcriptional regulator/PAS domain-containing protein